MTPFTISPLYETGIRNTSFIHEYLVGRRGLTKALPIDNITYTSAITQLITRRKQAIILSRGRRNKYVNLAMNARLARLAGMRVKHNLINIMVPDRDKTDASGDRSK